MERRKVENMQDLGFLKLLPTVEMLRKKHSRQDYSRTKARRLWVDPLACVCSCCEKYSSKLYAHHVDSNPMNNAPENIEVLCPSCHRDRHPSPFVKNLFVKKCRC